MYGSNSESLDVAIAITAIRQILRGYEVEALVGSSNLISDQGSLLCDMGQIVALEAASELVDEAVVLSPSRALILPRATSASWEVFLTRMFSQDADNCIKKLRHRPSCNGGRTWAKPMALESQIAAKRSRDKDTKSGTHAPDPVGLISIRGPLGAYPEELKQALMHSIGVHLGLTVTRGDPARSLQPQEWMEVRGGNGDWNGQIRLQLASLTELASLRSLLDSSAVELEGELRTVEVFNPYLQENGSSVHFPGSQGNASGEGGRRPSPQ